MPIYDRALHDPVAGAHVVAASHRLVLVEGLYVGAYTGDDDAAASNSGGPGAGRRSSAKDGFSCWQDVHDLLDVRVFLHVPEEAMVHRLTRRKMMAAQQHNSAATATASSSSSSSSSSSGSNTAPPAVTVLTAEDVRRHIERVDVPTYRELVRLMLFADFVG